MNSQPLPRGRFGPIKPYTWPQDRINVPAGYGTMAAVETLNAKSVKREFFAYNADFSLTEGTAGEQIIATDPDGDFWLDSICIFCDGQDMPPGRFQIEDVSQGFTLFSPTAGAPLTAFNYVFAFNVVGAPALAAGAGLRTSVIQPYCFLRNAGIRFAVNVEAFALSATYKLFISLAGWKEYDNAAT